MKWKAYVAIAGACVFALVAVALASDPLFARYFFDRHAAYLLLLAVFVLYAGFVVRHGSLHPSRRSRAARIMSQTVTTAGIVLLIATLASHHWQVGWTNSSSKCLVHLGGGNFTVFWFTPAPNSRIISPVGPPGWEIAPNEYRMSLWPGFESMALPTSGGSSSGMSSYIELPLWIPLMLCVLTLIVLIRRDRHRFQSGHCQRCGYDLTGNVSGICPECGAPAGVIGKDAEKCPTTRT